MNNNNTHIPLHSVGIDQKKPIIKKNKCDLSSFTNCQLEDILIQIENKTEQKKDYNLCPECGSGLFFEDHSKGIIICECGLVINDIYDNTVERRNYDGDEGENVRMGMVHNKLLPQSSLGTILHIRGKIRKLHIWNAMPYKERSDNVMFKRIHEICVNYNIVKMIEEDAKILCKKVSGTVHKNGKNKGKPIITRGDNRAGIVAACVFIACRRNDDTRSSKEIATYFNIDERDVNKGVRSLMSILDDDGIVKEIGTSKVLHFIKRKCDELKLPNRFTDVALTIAKNIERLNIASNHTTFSLAAACILLMAEIHGIKNINKKILSKAFFDLSDVTIGKTYKQIKEFKSVLVDNSKVTNIIIDINKQKERRVISKEVWIKMIQFGVDTSKFILEDQDKYIDEYIKSHCINLDRMVQQLKYIESTKPKEIEKTFQLIMEIDKKFNIIDNIQNNNT